RRVGHFGADRRRELSERELDALAGERRQPVYVCLVHVVIARRVVVEGPPRERRALAQERRGRAVEDREVESRAALRGGLLPDVEPDLVDLEAVVIRVERVEEQT